MVYSYIAPSHVSDKTFDVLDKHVHKTASIQIVYSNSIHRMLAAWMFDGHFFPSFHVYDENEVLKVHIKENITWPSSKTYTALYYKEAEPVCITIKQLGGKDIIDTFTFEYNGMCFLLEKAPFDWAKLKADHTVVAKWMKSQLPPFHTKLHITDGSCKEDFHLFLAIFHACFYIQ